MNSEEFALFEKKIKAQERFSQDYYIVGRPSHIDYFKITPESFSWNDGNIQTIPLEANEKGFISEDLVKKIKPEESDTCIVNVGVGFGKTTAIYDVIREYGKAKKYKVLVVSPYKKLVQKDYDELNTGGQGFTLTEYSEIDDLEDDRRDNETRREHQGRVKKHIDNLIEKDVHILTINTLLQNPGEGIFELSAAKRYYVKSLLKHCKKNNQKVVIVCDEIHAGVHHFKAEYVFNLLRWKGCVHKIFILSATFTEASLVAIEHFAYLTDYKAKIYDYKREKRGDQARLHIHFTKPYSESNATPLKYVEELILYAKERGKLVNVLVYSKRLAKGLRNKFWESKLFAKHKIDKSEFNLLTADEKNVFDPSKINVGTTFLTGVNLDVPDSVLIIIMPSSAYKGIKSGGIFSDGYVSIHQAVGRLRNGGVINIFCTAPSVILDSDASMVKSELEEPDSYNFKSLKKLIDVRGIENPLRYPIAERALQEFLKYPIFKNYKPLNEQGRLIKRHYDNHKAKMLPEINRAFYEFMERTKNLDDKERILMLFNRQYEKRLTPQYIPYQDFLLHYGTDYVSKCDESFGKDFSPYIFWAAFYNQFVNVTSEFSFSFHYDKQSVIFSDGEFGSQIRNYFNDDLRKFDDSKALGITFDEALERLRFDNTEKLKSVLTIGGTQYKSEPVRWPRPFKTEVLRYLLTEIYKIDLGEEFKLEDYIEMCLKPENENLLAKEVIKEYRELRIQLKAIIGMVNELNEISIDTIEPQRFEILKTLFSTLQKKDSILSNQVFDLEVATPASEIKPKKKVVGEIEVIKMDNKSLFRRAFPLCFYGAAHKKKPGTYQVTGFRKF